MAELVTMSFSIAGLMNVATADVLHPVAAVITYEHLSPVKYHTAQVSANAASAAVTGSIAISRMSCSADMFSFIVRLSGSRPVHLKVAEAVSNME